MKGKKKSFIGWADSKDWQRQFGFRGILKKHRIERFINEPFLAFPTVYRYRKTHYSPVNPYPYSDGQQRVRITIEELSDGR